MGKGQTIDDHEGFIDNRHVREHLKVSRTKAYEIIKEMEDESPDAVFRYGRSLRVRKDVFDRWVSERCGEPPPPQVLGFATPAPSNNADPYVSRARTAPQPTVPQINR